MGTRGMWGYAFEGREVLQYVQFDSYPSGWPVENILPWLREQDVDDLRQQFSGLEQVSMDQSTVPDGEVARLKEFHDGAVSTGSPHEWYSLLRLCQGNPVATMRSKRFCGSPDFARDSLFCEYAYVIDLDTEMLEAYIGFQEELHEAGRFADRWEVDAIEEQRKDTYQNKAYYPIRMIAAWPLRELPTDADFVRVIETAKQDDYEKRYPEAKATD